MRLFVFLLILANLLFYAWTHDYLGASRDSESYRVAQQLRVEQIRVVSNDLPPPEVARPEKSARVVEKPQAEVCLVLADMPLAEGEALENLLVEKLPAFKVLRTTTPGTSSFWVNMPPQKNKRDAETKAAELKKLGIKEFFIVQESGPNNLAISLGLFSTGEAAESALRALRDKGVRSARVTERSLKPAMAHLELRGPEAQAAEMNQVLTEAAPGTSRSDCKLRNVAQ